MIDYRELPSWIPGRLLTDSGSLHWPGLNFRQYQYGPKEVEVPGLSDYLLIWYRSGSTYLNRNVSGTWQEGRCVPGDITLLTRSEKSEWRWDGNVDVYHVYLEQKLVSKIASEICSQPVSYIALHDRINVKDVALSWLIQALSREAFYPAEGGDLMAESIGTQIAISLLRKYADIEANLPHQVHGFSTVQKRQLEDYVQTSLGQTFGMDDLTSLLDTPHWSFSAKFRQTFDMSLPEYVMRRRLEQATYLIRTTHLPMKHVAMDCGFSDQAHMTRSFKKLLGTTPAAYRTESRGCSKAQN